LGENSFWQTEEESSYEEPNVADSAEGKKTMVLEKDDPRRKKGLAGEGVRENERGAPTFQTTFTTKVEGLPYANKGVPLGLSLGKENQTTKICPKRKTKNLRREYYYPKMTGPIIHYPQEMLGILGFFCGPHH